VKSTSVKVALAIGSPFYIRQSRPGWERLSNRRQDPPGLAKTVACDEADDASLRQLQVSVLLAVSQNAVQKTARERARRDSWPKIYPI